MTHLEFFRINKKWSQKTLGELPTVGIGRDFISFFENGHARPTPAQAERLARALGCPAELLMEPVPDPVAHA